MRDSRGIAEGEAERRNEGRPVVVRTGYGCTAG